MIKSRFFLFLVLIFTYTIAYSSPTKQETFKFIKKKVHGYKWEHNIGENIAYLSSTNEYCTIYIENLSKDEGAPLSRKFLVVNLEDIDPTEAHLFLDGYTPGLRTHTREEKKSVMVFWDTLDKNKHDDTQSFFWLMTNNEKNAHKVKSAIVHLVELCGGKGELF